MSEHDMENAKQILDAVASKHGVHMAFAAKLVVSLRSFIHLSASSLEPDHADEVKSLGVEMLFSVVSEMVTTGLITQDGQEELFEIVNRLILAATRDFVQQSEDSGSQALH